jgi:ArsR family transcriptional regulator, arsenate/arsenite/antimonite-responsive transcriptional repressor
MKNSLVKIYKVLADESRLRVLNLLDERACCVCEVMQVLEISQSKASRILTALYDAGVLKLQKEGQWSHYSIDWEGMENTSHSIINTTIKALRRNEISLTDRKRLKKAKKVGPGCVKSLETT